MAPPGWPDWSPPAPEAPSPPPAGRHRAGWRFGRDSGPVGMAALIASALVVFGIGAMLFPALIHRSSDDRPATTADRGAGTGGGVTTTPSEEPSAVPSQTPTPTPSTRTPTPRISTNASFEAEVVELVNRERTRARPRCEPLRVDSRLHAAARAHSADMAAQNYFSHTGKDGSSPSDRVQRAGYPGGAGENIAAGQASPRDVMASWMRSDGHRRNIVNCQYKAIGVGLAYRGRTPYWTQNFGAQ